MDIPLTPHTLGARSMGAYVTGMTEEILLKEREEVLNCTVDDVRKLADYVQAVLDDQMLCVVGNETLLKKEERLFGTLEPLFRA